jgi:dolichyl-phosphate beta-glucosyltransferase
MKLSLLIPALNEASRLPPYLRAIKNYFGRAQISYEVIVIDDGSTDGMSESLPKLFLDWQQFRIVRHAENQGRGQALQTGNTVARGELVMFADADGATPIEEEAKLRQAIEDGADMAIGSRVICDDRVSRFRVFHRAVVSKVFAALVKNLFSLPLRDTQCGFKMWRQEIGRNVLPLCQEKHWLLDFEMLAVAHDRGCRIAEVPVSWSEIPGSKVRLVRDSWQMFCGLWRIRKALKQRHIETKYRGGPVFNEIDTYQPEATPEHTSSISSTF